MREKTFRSNHSFNKKRGRGGRPSGNFSKSRRNNVPQTDVSRYVKKAVGTAALEEYVPKNQFSDFNIIPQLKKNIADKGFVKPTLIQDQAIPEILQGKDVIGIANTGTGKTASFLIPLIEKVFKNKNERVLIILPTRELALQIVDELNTFAKSLSIYSALCIGGSAMSRQIHALRRNPNFVIGTPGRLKDLINRNILKISNFNNVVLDEVDRMLDMGFINDIKHLISLMPTKRQSLFFSATVSKEVDNLILRFVSNPIKISVKSGETADNIEQDIVRVKDRTQKIEALHELLIKDEFKKVLIFGRTKREVENLSRALHERGFKADSIHGDKSQSKRERVLRLFRSNQLQTLVATDVAARGLDILDITHVINYDPPNTYDDYIHRIGRTGRANKTGKALTFVN